MRHALGLKWACPTFLAIAGATAAPATGALIRPAAAPLWSTDPTVNTPVSIASLDQDALGAAPEGAGGMLLGWEDSREGEQDIYLQHLSGSGTELWTVNGVAACKAAGLQLLPAVMPDGFGGAIAVWEDRRGGGADVYAQRIGSDGSTRWTANGVVVCAAPGDQTRPLILGDGAGGFVIAWEDARAGAGDIYAQRLSLLGAPLWTPDGVAVCAATGAQDRPTLAADGLGGVVAAWRDFRGGGSDVYAQRLDTAGASQWVADGVAVCVAGGDQGRPSLIADGSGGVVLAWEDLRGATEDIYAQRVGASGSPQWTANGVALCSAAGDQSVPVLVADGAGGAVVAWQDGRGPNLDIYTQRVSASGVPEWTTDGVALCTAAGNQEQPVIVSDGAAGAVVAWQDARVGGVYDVYARRVGANGGPQWTVDGVAVSAAAGDQKQVVAVTDGGGGALVAWQDRRSGTFLDLYAQRVAASGQLGDPCVLPTQLSSNFNASSAAAIDYFSFDQNEVYWAAVAVRGTTGDWDLEIYGNPDGGPSPVCFSAPLGGSFETGMVDFVVGDFNPGRTPVGTYYARTVRYSGSGSASVEWDDGTDDIFRDGAPVSRNTNGSDVIETWDCLLASNSTYTLLFSHSGAADLKALVFGSPPGSYWAARSGRRVETTANAVFTSGASGFYGIVVVNDNGENGSYSIQIVSGQPVGTADPGSPPVTRLDGFEPNPAPGSTRMRFTLAEAGRVVFHVLDLAGREVAEPISRAWEAGTWTLPWDARDAAGRRLRPGLYVVRMDVAGRPVGRSKLVILE